ncbi:Uncharacterized protein HZ326_21036 [Fusarium oxysporum f. sp. albedinis]|nr:Uncharacterized protein HZ326_21036 [Fusarium oxysporum f. sp. albedinis]
MKKQRLLFLYYWIIYKLTQLFSGYTITYSKSIARTQWGSGQGSALIRQHFSDLERLVMLGLVISVH